ncbi:hypothetical protein GQ55_9G155100 [Panicum hallii var. hallii]|jgi:large subunit ribosomal protein L4|uniref:Large ribosomal subunit protein uL4m n=1 Tax=Panicum hallii var. hallii TaxID=1504633 RepID=A0A2T7C3H7_9POAL|nr:hypothetical protein GQ55_9G155100 [Panicum hallii var. hallii]
MASIICPLLAIWVVDISTKQSLVVNIWLIIHSSVKKSIFLHLSFLKCALVYLTAHDFSIDICFNYCFHFQNLPASCFSGYSTLLAPANEVLIPPELLSSKTVWTPDRELGQYEDLVARVTNFHNEDKGFMVLDGDVFDVPIRKDIVHRVVRWQLAKRQQGTHSTKTISEVSGTGKKPYKQKGTGRARHGTLRGPQFRGGATMHGPKPRSHAIKLQKKVRRLGLKIALSARTAEGKLLIFEDLEVPSHKTKNIVQYIRQMDDTKKVLLVDGDDIDKKLKLATQNLHYVNVLPSIGLNVYSILQHDTLVMTRAAINRIVERMHTPINR